MGNYRQRLNYGVCDKDFLLLRPDLDFDEIFDLYRFLLNSLFDFHLSSLR